MRKALFAAVLAVVFFALAFSLCAADTPEERAVKAAKIAAEDMGITAGEAEIIYDPENKRWEERVLAISRNVADPNHGLLPLGMLYNKKYDTVLLDFKEGAKTGDLWVFVDEDTGDMITVYQEK